MAEMLLLIERVKNTIALGESHYREFKSAMEGRPDSKQPRRVSQICADIGEALVAFANADGGELLIGVEDDGAITGVHHDGVDIALMLNAIKTHVHKDSVLPMLANTKLEIDGNQVLFFSVAKGATEVYQLPDGRCVRRKDKNTMPETVRRIQFDRQEIRSREYDRGFVDGAMVTDLDLTMLEAMANEYLRGLSIERYLQQIGVAEYSSTGLRLRMAALLLFATKISQWHPRSQVRILTVVGTELGSGENYNVTKDESVEGNIFELLRQSWEKLRPFLAYKTEFGADAKFEQKYIYPEWACREALVNAIAHRDYSIQSGIEVRIFDDRMEIRSPGGLLSTLRVRDLEELSGAHESRNALVARILRENQYMREMGEGMKRIFQLTEQNDLQQPRLHSDDLSFSVVLPSRSVFSTRQEQWLGLFSDFQLSSLQKKIIVLGIDGQEISPKDIYKAMNTNDRDTYDREVTGLRTNGTLKEIRSNANAQSLAHTKGVPKNTIPRFEVIVPTATQASTTRSIIGGGDLQPKPSSVSDQCAVYICNLAHDVTEADVTVLCQQCGDVIRCKIPSKAYNGSNTSKFAFVHFANAEMAQHALRTLDGQQVHSRSIKVKPYVRRPPN